MESILQVDQLSKSFGKIKAVNQLSFKVGKGQVFGILGPNGSGKTTTLSMLLGLIPPDKGEFSWFGQPPSKESRKRIGSVIESPNFFPYLDAVTNLQIVADIKDKPYDDIDEVLQLASLYERRFSKFRTFSFGMRQRLAIASALLGKPEVLILDEPTNGLDPQGIAQIRELIALVASRGTTILLASHLLDEVQKICTYVLVLRNGVMLFSGDVKEVLSVSDSIEMAAADMHLLKTAVPELPGFSSITETDGIIQVHFSSTVKTSEVNAFLYQKGIVLSHLSEKKRSLEQHFLELLQDTP
ncbi:MAG: ATP-binding cassette domain-containing protein [Bacteroidetes bacterium]|nr:ATP-binding cassette domain-containing protein [Bacteroidota bacterium]